MSTPASIGKLNPEGSVQFVVVNWDGHRAGQTLKDNYVTGQKVDKLISLGDLSSLHPLLLPTTENHTFESPEPGICVFYHRDRGEDWEDTKAQTAPDVRSFYHMSEGIAYLYKNGGWYSVRENKAGAVRVYKL